MNPHIYTHVFISHALQEPIERKLGHRMVTTTKNMRPYFKTVWDHVYDIPLLSSLQQLLSDKFVLQEVTCTCTCIQHIHYMYA